MIEWPAPIASCFPDRKTRPVLDGGRDGGRNRRSEDCWRVGVLPWEWLAIRVIAPGEQDGRTDGRAGGRTDRRTRLGTSARRPRACRHATARRYLCSALLCGGSRTALFLLFFSFFFLCRADVDKLCGERSTGRNLQAWSRYARSSGGGGYPSPEAAARSTVSGGDVDAMASHQPAVWGTGR